MAELKIRLTDDSIIQMLDMIVSDENYESRNQLINHILTLYCTSRSKFISNSLPSIVNSMCMENLEKTTELSQKTLDIFIPLVAEIKTKLDEIGTVLGVNDV